MNKQYLTPATAPTLDTLTKGELKVLRLIVSGKHNREIASDLKISVRTVETFRQHILKKLKLRSIPDLVFYAIRHKLINPEGKLAEKMMVSF